MLSRQPVERLDPDVRRVAIVIVLGMIMSVLDTTIVNVALDSLSRDLHTPLTNIQWVVSAYLLALAAVIPLSAWAVRRYSAFRVYMQALVLFTLGSALCGLATTSGQLIVFRALQGLGGGLLAPAGLTILVNAAGRDNLPRVMSAIGVPLVLAPVFGPTLGGFLLQSVSWHAIFMINVPIGIATAVVALRLLPRDHPDSSRAGPLDWPGLLLAGLGTVGITYGLSQSAVAGSFTSMTVIGPMVVGALLVVAFVLRSRAITRPLLDLRLYSIRAYSAASVVMFCMGAALFGAMILLPLYFQVARGQDAITTGLLLIPQGVGASIGMNRSALATRRFGAGLTSLCGVLIMVVRDRPVPLRGDLDALRFDRRGDGGAGRGRRLGVYARHDRGFLAAQPRSSQRRQSAAQRHPTGRRVIGDGHHRRRPPNEARRSARSRHEAWRHRKCRGCLVRPNLPLGDPHIDARPHPRHRPVACRTATASDRPREQAFRRGASRGDRMTTLEPTATRPSKTLDELRMAMGELFGAERRLRGREQQQPRGLTYSQLRALFVLDKSPEVTAGDLAKSADLNPASVTAMLDQLEANGIVERRRDREDRRVRIVSLTDEGRGIRRG